MQLQMKPRVAITAGDPAGIGSETAAPAAADLRMRTACDPVALAPDVPSGVLSGEAGRARLRRDRPGGVRCRVRRGGRDNDRAKGEFRAAPVDRLYP